MKVTNSEFDRIYNIGVRKFSSTCNRILKNKIYSINNNPNQNPKKAMLYLYALNTIEKDAGENYIMNEDSLTPNQVLAIQSRLKEL